MRQFENPWEKIELLDYIGHMSEPEIGQYQMINKYFKKVYQYYLPERILFPGCTSGNGFEHINRKRIKNITGVDINETFLDAASQIYGNDLPLNLIHGDIQSLLLDENYYDLVFAALIFEYVNIEKVLHLFSTALRKGGKLAVLLQQPVELKGIVSKSKYTNLRILEPVINLITEEEFKKMALDKGFEPVEEKLVTMPNGKSFFQGEFNLKK